MRTKNEIAILKVFFIAPKDETPKCIPKLLTLIKN